MFLTVAILPSPIPAFQPICSGFRAQLDDLSQQHNLITWPICARLYRTKDTANLTLPVTFDDGVRDHYVNVFRICASEISGLFFALDREETDGRFLPQDSFFNWPGLDLTGLRDAFETLNSAQRTLYSAEGGYDLISFHLRRCTDQPA